MTWQSGNPGVWHCNGFVINMYRAMQYPQCPYELTSGFKSHGRFKTLQAAMLKAESIEIEPEQAKRRPTNGLIG